jgi:O-antigen/teichoic acid export membrane protein
MISKLFMALSIFIRMLIGIVVFALMARGLGPKEFGLVSLIFSYASLGSLLTDFGLTMKTLRDIAHEPNRGKAILIATMKIKLIFAVIVTTIGCMLMLIFPVTGDAKFASYALTVGVMVASFGDLALVAFRATDQFGRESWIVGWTSMIYGIVVSIIVYLGGGILAISVGFLLCRILYASVAFSQAMRLLPNSKDSGAPYGFRQSVKAALSWALLSNLSYINGQIDGLIIAPLLGLHGTGIYQSGAKFVSSAVTFASVVTNTQVPVITAAVANNRPKLRLEILAWIQMLMVGAFLGLLITLSGPLITQYLIGSQYAEVNQLWLGFGFLIFFRFASSAVLVSLVALNCAKTNLFGEAATTVVSLPLLIVLVPSYGLVSVPWIMCAGAIATATVLVFGRLRVGTVLKL